MDYQIIKATPETGQIEVLYKEGGTPVGTYAIDVPVVDGAFITGQALHDEIVHRAPTWLIKRKQEVQTATGFDQITALVQPLPVVETDAETIANHHMWAQLDFEKKTAAALMKFGVLQSDPTTIPVASL